MEKELLRTAAADARRAVGACYLLPRGLVEVDEADGALCGWRCGWRCGRLCHYGLNWRCCGCHGLNEL